MIKNICLYIVPFIPFITRSLFIILPYRKIICKNLEKEQPQPETHRNFISILSGFTFSALLAIVILQKTSSYNLTMIIYYLFLSFICYYFSFNIQSYKSSILQDQIGDTFINTASLSLILSIIACLLSTKPYHGIYTFLILFSLLIWTIDHIIRLGIECRYLKAKMEVQQ